MQTAAIGTVANSLPENVVILLTLLASKRYIPYTNLLKNWTLPIGMACGLLGFLAFHYVHWLAPLKPAAAEASSALMPTVLFVMLFATFCKVDPRLMRVTPWHAWLVAFQLLSCLAIALILHFAPASGHALLPEGLMICLVCPTAGAAAVITGKLGGSETTLTTYTILSNLAAAIIIPLVFPLVESRADAPFLSQFLTILRRVFPLLICPFLLAWGLREFFPKAHARVVAGCRDLAFYLWGFGLVLSVGQTCRFLADSPVGAHIKWLLSVVSLAACALQFALGKGIGARYGERIGGGQRLGQKNTIFGIWVSYTYLSPVLAVAPDTYIIWQNLFNSWQLWRKRKRDERQSEALRHSQEAAAEKIK